MSLSAFRRSRFCICSTCSACRCPSVPYLVRYQRPTEESVLSDASSLTYLGIFDYRYLFQCRHFMHGVTDVEFHRAGTRV